MRVSTAPTAYAPSARQIIAAIVLLGLFEGGYAEEAIEEILVTGTYIRGTPEDSALPVDVITAEERERLGNPDIIETIQRMPAVTGGTIGQTNRGPGINWQGGATINLRGLGPERTLVLVNGQRLPGHDFSLGTIDLAQIPYAAVGRVEVLRDGAAVAYGSDAIGGVVNFITRRDLDGLEVTGSYTAIEHSDGDVDLGLAYGWNDANRSVLIAANYAHTDEIRLRHFDFMRSLPVGQGDGKSLAGNPGTYLTLADAVDADGDGFFESAQQGVPFRDLGCSELGAETVGPFVCTYPFLQLEAAVNETERMQVFAETGWDLSNDTTFHVDAYYAYTDVPHVRTSVSSPTLRFPTPIEASGASPGGGTSPFPAQGNETNSRFYVPPDNPGLVALMTDGGCPYAQAVCDSALTTGVVAAQSFWRPRALGGSPLFDGDTNEARNESMSYRISGGFDGTAWRDDWRWSSRVTYGRAMTRTRDSDLIINRVQLGLRGLGGPECDAVMGMPGLASCEWFNPFANSITHSIINGASYAEATGRSMGPLNSKRLWDWMNEEFRGERTSEVLTAEALITGDTANALQAPGGPVAWAIGTQWRWIKSNIALSPNLDNSATPCIDSPPFGDGMPDCPLSDFGPFLFVTGVPTMDLHSDVASVFGEVQVPVFDALDIGIAGRYESHGGGVGTTEDYRISARLQVLPWLVGRGSFGTSFRAPPQRGLLRGPLRSFAGFTDLVTRAALVRVVDVYGNPALDPETAETYNVGLVVETDAIELAGIDVGRFDGSIDYFEVRLKQEISLEPPPSVFGATFPSADPSTWACDVDALRERFKFDDSFATNTYDYNGLDEGGIYPSCHPSNLLGLSVNIFNASGKSVVSGLDMSFTWSRAAIGGEVTAGAEASYLEERSFAPQYLIGTDVEFAPATEQAGTAELLSGYWSYPDWRGNGYINYERDHHNVRLITHYYAGIRDTNAGFQHRDSHVTHDIVYRLDLPSRTVLTLTVANFTDEEPPYVRSFYNYDYTTYSPLGRTFALAIKKNF